MVGDAPPAAAGAFMSTQQMSSPLTSGSGGEPILSLALTGRGPVTVIVATGEIDMSSAHLLTELVDAVMRDQPLRVVLDLANVTFFCAAGVTALLEVRRAVTARAGRLVLRDP